MCYIDKEYDGYIASTGFAVLRPNKDVFPELLSFVLCSDYFVNEVNIKSIGVSYPAINDNNLLSIKIALPKSIEEQKRLYYRIKEQTQNFDMIIEKIGKEIALFNEYRTRLISDVVTGKIDVRGVVVPEYFEENQDESMDVNLSREEDYEQDDERNNDKKTKTNKRGSNEI